MVLYCTVLQYLPYMIVRWTEDCVAEAISNSIYSCLIRSERAMDGITGHSRRIQEIRKKKRTILYRPILLMVIRNPFPESELP